MIHDRTVFILGAGASRPYLFPTASELTNLILKEDEPKAILDNMGFELPPHVKGLDPKVQENDIRMQYRQWLDKRLEDHRISKFSVEQFQERFRSSQLYSVDSFIAKNPEFEQLGSLLVACILLKCENERALSGDWYRILLNELLYEGNDFPEGMLSIITFNYDRSLEMYLFTAFKNAFDLGADEARRMLERINIIHVYGDLGNLPFTDDPNSVKYGNNGAMKQASKRIKLVTPRCESERRAEITAILQPARRIVFLGFGFDPMNLKAIGITKPSSQCLASCYGLSASLKRRGEDILVPRTAISPPVLWGNDMYKDAEYLQSIPIFA